MYETIVHSAIHGSYNTIYNLHVLENGSWLLNSLRCGTLWLCKCYAVRLSIREIEILQTRGSVTTSTMPSRWRAAMTHQRLVRICTSRLPYVHNSWAQHRKKSQQRDRKHPPKESQGSNA